MSDRTVEGQVLDADGNPVRWRVENTDGCPSCGAGKADMKSRFGGKYCSRCGHMIGDDPNG